jgi:hypothetical protein
MAKKTPEAFIEGTIEAFIRAIDVINLKEEQGTNDSTFKHRALTGHHSGEDAFLDIFRTALGKIAAGEPTLAAELLKKMDPGKHEVFTHIWLETISVNSSKLCYLLHLILAIPHLWDAGWTGAAWLSFANAVKESIPYMTAPQADLMEQKILTWQPELTYAKQVLFRIKREGENGPWICKSTVINYLKRSGYKQLYILKTIGKERLTESARHRLAQLQRKFPDHKVQEPAHNLAHFVSSPIRQEKAAFLTDNQWLKAIALYHNDGIRRYGRNFTEGGPRELAGILRQLAKEQPNRFAKLLDRIPDNAHQAYISQILMGLTEADAPDDNSLCNAILNAHARSERPYGIDITRIIDKHPHIAADSAIFDILIWYVEQGEASEEPVTEASSIEREIVTINDLISDTGRIHIRGINGAKSWAAEALEKVLWQVPELIGKTWDILDKRIRTETLISVRCSLLTPLVPLFKHNRQRCAEFIERLSRAPGTSKARSKPAFLEKAWVWLVFPPECIPFMVKHMLLQTGRLLEHFVRRFKIKLSESEDSKWLSPLLTYQAIDLLPYVFYFIPEIGKRLIFRLLVCGNTTSRMICAWYIFRLSFADKRYILLADMLMQEGAAYRMLMADVASQSVAEEEYRHHAEDILKKCFDDADHQVRQQATDVFHHIDPAEFERCKDLAKGYINSRAFEGDSYAFFHLLENASCRVDDIVIPAAERIITVLEQNRHSDGQQTPDLYQIRKCIKKVYALSERDADLHKRLLDIIDKILTLDPYGANDIIEIHER